MGLELFDMHCHLGFSLNPKGLADGLAARRIGALSCGVDPASYPVDRTQLADCPNVRVGLGLHPWFAEDARLSALERFEAACSLPETRFIGEVGLDFSSRHESTREEQLLAFGVVASAVAKAGSKLVSIHAVSSAAEVLDMLERSGALSVDAGNTIVFHWFSGTSDDLVRARRAGCLFSIGERMLQTRRGRAYAREIPADQLLLETDLPAHEGASLHAGSVEASLQRSLDALAEVRGENRGELAALIASTSAQLVAADERARRSIERACAESDHVNAR